MYTSVWPRGRECSVQCGLGKRSVHSVWSRGRKCAVKCGLEEGSVQCGLEERSVHFSVV